MAAYVSSFLMRPASKFLYTFNAFPIRIHCKQFGDVAKLLFVPLPRCLYALAEVSVAWKAERHRDYFHFRFNFVDHATFGAGI